MLFYQAVEEDKALGQLLVRLLKPGYLTQSTVVAGIHREDSIGVGEEVLHKIHGPPQKLYRLLQSLFLHFGKESLELCAQRKIILYIALVGGVIKIFVDVSQIPFWKCL